MSFFRLSSSFFRFRHLGDDAQSYSFQFIFLAHKWVEIMRGKGEGHAHRQAKPDFERQFKLRTEGGRHRARRGRIERGDHRRLAAQLRKDLGVLFLEHSGHRLSRLA